MNYFYTPWKRQKTIEGFLTFVEDIKIERWVAMG